MEFFMRASLISFIVGLICSIGLIVGIFFVLKSKHHTVIKILYTIVSILFINVFIPGVKFYFDYSTGDVISKKIEFSRLEFNSVEIPGYIFRGKGSRNLLSLKDDSNDISAITPLIYSKSGESYILTDDKWTKKFKEDEFTNSLIDSLIEVKYVKTDEYNILVDIILPSQ